MQEETTAALPPQRSRVLLWPLAIFVIMALLFALALRSGDPSKLPSALIGRERMLEAYAHAIREEYRFYSYGDASLLLP